MPRTQEQFKEIRDARKKQIMQVAMQLFAREGFGHVSIATLAKEAGISKGLMYNYFDSKEKLLKEIIELGFYRISEQFDSNHDGKITPDEFEHFVRTMFRIIREEKEFWLQFFSIIIQPYVFPYIKTENITTFMQNVFLMLDYYFKDQGFEDSELELFHFSVLIEGFGAMMLIYDNISPFPDQTLNKFEERIINTYVRKS